MMDLDRVNNYLARVEESEKTTFKPVGSRLKVGVDLGTAYIVLVVLDEGYITNVAVRPDCRRQGIAGKLLQVFLDFAKGNHLAFLSLEVRASNYDAIALYGSRGFRSVGRRKNYYEHPKEDAIIMTKEFEHGAENADTGTVADGVRS